jgi:crotonobetainyl-CoA:carnitine CoA-transferase CaiB-like acyl-CoA transferase
MQKGLAGIRVVDLSDRLAGPNCSKLFVDEGAKIITIDLEAGGVIGTRPEGP